MKNLKYRTILKAAFILLMVSCNDFLDETPDNRTFIDSPEKIAELLVGAYPDAAYAPFLEPMSDNAGDKGPSANIGIDMATTLNDRMFFWDDITTTDQDTPTNYWNRAYKAIAQANQALASIEQLGGGTELNHLKGEALICRAYAHFMLVNMFSKTYNPVTASTDIGVPYVKTPETVLIKDYDRGNVKNVYENIKLDLEAGLPLVKDNYKSSAFHFTKQAAHAFASRFYLQIGDWEKVITHSTIAIGDQSGKNLRDITNDYSAKTYDEQSSLYTSTLEPANLLLVSAESLYDRYHASARYQLNKEKLDEIFPSDNGTGSRWSFSVFGSDLYYNVPKFREYFKVTNQAAGIGRAFASFVLLTTDEALLNRAEAYAMLGQFQNATDDINMSYSVKTSFYDPVLNKLSISDIQIRFHVFDSNLYKPFYEIPSESLAFVNAILTMKRAIFYNEGLRWFDNKRHNMVIEHKDISGTVFTLSGSDNRRLLQIPEAAQSLGIEKSPR